MYQSSSESSHSVASASSRSTRERLFGNLKSKARPRSESAELRDIAEKYNCGALLRPLRVQIENLSERGIDEIKRSLKAIPEQKNACDDNVCGNFSDTTVENNYIEYKNPSSLRTESLDGSDSVPASSDLTSKQGSSHRDEEVSDESDAATPARAKRKRSQRPDSSLENSPRKRKRRDDESTSCSEFIINDDQSDSSGVTSVRLKRRSPRRPRRSSTLAKDLIGKAIQMMRPDLTKTEKRTLTNQTLDFIKRSNKFVTSSSSISDNLSQETATEVRSPIADQLTRELVSLNDPTSFHYTPVVESRLRTNPRKKSVGVGENASDDEKDVFEEKTPAKVRPRIQTPRNVARRTKGPLPKFSRTSISQNSSPRTSSSVSQPQKSSDIRNDKTFIHHSSPKYHKMCAICGERSRNIVFHYKYKHPADEVFTSRLSVSYANKIRAGPVQGKRSGVRLCAPCYFCEEEKDYTTDYWPMHILNHTGEWNLYCSTFEKIVSRDHQSKCKNTCKTIRQYKFVDGHLGAFMCKLCNYVQTIETNVEEHLKHHHSISHSFRSQYADVRLVSDPSSRRHVQAVAEEPGKNADKEDTVSEITIESAGQNVVTLSSDSDARPSEGNFISHDSFDIR